MFAQWTVRHKRRSPLAPYFFIGVGVLYLAIFTGIPVLKGIDLSFTDTKLLNPVAVPISV